MRTEKHWRLGGRLEAVPPWELLLARQEARGMDGPAEERALRDNACLVARAWKRRGRRVYTSGAAVLADRSPAQIERMARRWSRRWGGRRRPGDLAALKEAVAELPWQRLRWRVLRTFQALPSEARAKELTEEEYLWCAVNLLLDEEEALGQLCPSCRAEAQRARCPVCGGETGAVVREENPAFDLARFERMKRGERA